MLYFHKVCITEVKLLRRERQQKYTTMSNEERKEKLEEQLSQIRQQAAEVEAALQSQKERKDFAKMVEEERARQDAKKRTFANAQNADEADGLLPSMEELANGQRLPSKEQLDTGEVVMGTPRGWKTKTEILEDGTLIQKLRLYFSSLDLSGYFGNNGKLTKEEVAKVAASIRTKEDKELVWKCYNEYSALRKYGEQLRFYFKRFQTSFAMLAVSLNKWDGYESTAKQLSHLFNFNPEGEQLSDIIDADKYPYEPPIIHKDDVERFYSPEKVEAFLSDISKRVTFEGATLKVDKERLCFVVDVFGKGGLYSQIKEEAEAAKEDLSDFKAFADVVEEFIKGSTLFYMPISIQMSIENAEEERYTRYLVKNLSFFRSDLNERRENGDTITPEDEKRAVIPDFYEVTPTKEVYKSCKKYIKDLMADGK